jgi:hypothetical protein
MRYHDLKEALTASSLSTTGDKVNAFSIQSSVSVAVLFTISVL